MYLNTKMFADAGIEIPADTWTVEEFVEVAQQLTSGAGADEQWGYYWANYTDQTFAFIAAFGGALYSEDGKSSVLSTDENTMRGLQFMYDLYNTYQVCPSAAEAAQFGDNEFSAFMANKVAMQIGALSTASTFDANGTEYTVLPMPYIDGVSKTSSFVNTWVIPKTAKNPELSWRVVEFLSGKEGQQIALDMNYGLPATTMVDTTAFEAAHAVQQVLCGRAGDGRCRSRRTSTAPPSRRCSRRSARCCGPARPRRKRWPRAWMSRRPPSSAPDAASGGRR